MTVANLVVAEFSPVAGTMVTAATAHSLGFGAHWFAAATGAPVSPPANATEIADAYDGKRPRRLDDVDTGWARVLDGKADYITRVMLTNPNGVALVRTSRGPNDVADLWWCHRSEARLARGSLPLTSDVELLAEGVGVLLDREQGRLERFHADRPDVFEIGLPGIVEPATARGTTRLFAALREADALVIGGTKRCYWMRISQLAGELGASVAWKIAWTFPGADGTRTPMPGAPHMVAEQTTAVVHRATLAPQASTNVPAKLKSQVASLREVGLFDEMTDETLVEYCEGVSTPSIVGLMLAYYETSASRARRDRYLVHDWRFGQETDDVIAELSGLLGSPPLFVQLANRRDGIRVRGPAGPELIELEGLDDVVSHFNRALARGTAFGDVRIYGLRTGDERHAYLALSKAVFDRLRAEGIPFG